MILANIKLFVKRNIILSKIYSYYKILKFIFQGKSLNKKNILSKKITSIGINLYRNSPQLIITLTSYPARIADSYFTIYSLLSQTYKPDKIVLWLSLDEFPEKTKSLPKNLIDLQKFGLTINWIPKTFNSYDKIIHSIKHFPDDILVTADDDIFYNKNWLKSLYETYRTINNTNKKNYIICHRMHKIIIKNGFPASYNTWQHEIKSNELNPLHFPTGCGGILYPPHSLYKDVCKEEIFTKIAPFADDIWLWGMALLNNWYFITANKTCGFKYININQECNPHCNNNLKYYNITMNNNDLQMRNLLYRYPSLFKIIQNGI